MAKLTGSPGIIVPGSPGAGTNPTTLAAADITTVVDTVASVPVLTKLAVGSGSDYAEYVYLRGIGSTVLGSVVTYDEAGVTALIAGNAIGPVAVAQAATVADRWGWYMVRGSCTAACDTVADNTQPFIDGTAGRVDDAVVAGDLIANMVIRSTDSSNLCTVQMNYPFVTDQMGA
jgi:hypothetical protein